MQALEKACLASFANAGLDVTLYSYESVPDFVPNVRTENASLIVPREKIGAFIYEGKPNLSHFSDYFRYKMFAQTDHVWIDSDMLLLRPIDIDLSGDLFAKETASSICGAIMRVRRDNPILQAAIARTESFMGKELVWGATGPRLLSQLLGRSAILEQAQPPSTFFPIHFDEFWKPFLPANYQECRELTRGSSTVHLWNNIVERMGVWKEVAPPVGSFLWHELDKMQLLGLFRDTYPESVMVNMVNNWRLRKSGGDIGAVKLAMQALPSIVRTTRPRMRALIQRWQ
jgi:hypothetical protein